MGTVPTHQQESAASNSGESRTLTPTYLSPIIGFLVKFVIQSCGLHSSQGRDGCRVENVQSFEVITPSRRREALCTSLTVDDASSFFRASGLRREAPVLSSRGWSPWPGVRGSAGITQKQQPPGPRGCAHRILTPRLKQFSAARIPDQKSNLEVLNRSPEALISRRACFSSALPARC